MITPVVPLNSMLQRQSLLEVVGEPESVTRIEIRSPATTETVFEVSLPVVPVSEIVAARLCATEFFITVTVQEVPAPGEPEVSM